MPVPCVKLIATIGTALFGLNFNSYNSSAFLPSFSLSNKIATDLPVSIGEPPPIAITAVAPKSFASAVASSIPVVVGFGVTLS